MSNKKPPEPKVCENCGEYFWGRKGAKTCSGKCRMAMKRRKDAKQD